jgi:hypothetical protein
LRLREVEESGRKAVHGIVVGDPREVGRMGEVCGPGHDGLDYYLLAEL